MGRPKIPAFHEERSALAERIAKLGLQFTDLAALTRQHKVTAHRWGSIREMPTWLEPFLDMYEAMSKRARQKMLATARDAEKK